MIYFEDILVKNFSQSSSIPLTHKRKNQTKKEIGNFSSCLVCISVYFLPLFLIVNKASSELHLWRTLAAFSRIVYILSPP